MPIPLPVIDQTYRCALKWKESGTGQTAVNVIHIGTASPGVAASDVFEVLDDVVTTQLWNAVKNTASVVEVDITPLDGTSATQSFATGSPARWTGNSTGNFIPQASILVKFQTASRGRDNRGRLFMPFVVEVANVDGAVEPSNLAAMATPWGAIQAALQADVTTPSHLVVASYDRRHSGAGAHASDITAITVEGVMATQRRRQSRLR